MFRERRRTNKDLKDRFRIMAHSMTESKGAVDHMAPLRDPAPELRDRPVQPPPPASAPALGKRYRDVGGQMAMPSFGAAVGAAVRGVLATPLKHHGASPGGSGGSASVRSTPGTIIDLTDDYDDAF